MHSHGTPGQQSSESSSPKSESDSFNPPVCKFSAKSLPIMSAKEGRRLEAPPTPGRPVFKFSVGSFSRKSIPSKWENAEKWLMSASFHESFANETKPVKQHKILPQKADPKSPVSGVEAFHGFSSAEESLFRDCETEESCATEAASEIHHKDVGTEMTPLGSSTTSRCNTPIKVSSPARHNTPADRSGPLVAQNSTIDLSELKNCHFAKLELSAQYDTLVSYWSTKEEEEEELSKSLRHSDMNGERRSVTDCMASLWEDDDRTKSCIRYQREEAKIQAWVNLQTAKAEAQSRKLEVKIQKMRSSLEEKVMKRMGIVYRKSEEWRAAAQLQHSQQILRAAEKAQRMKSQTMRQHSCHCGCFSMQEK